MSHIEAAPHPRRTAGWSLASVAALGTGAALTSAVQWFYQDAWTGWVAIPCLLLAAGAFVAIWTTAVRRGTDVRAVLTSALAIFWVVVVNLALVNVSLHLLEPQAYGDKDAIVGFLQRSQTFPRWFLGTALLKWTYAALMDAPFTDVLIPLEIQTFAGFVRAAGILTMGVTTVGMLLRWPGRLSVALPTLIPLWFAFSTGYLEYYPFIAWMVVAFLGMLYVDSKPLAHQSPYAVGIAAAALPLAYVGFAPLSLFLLAAYGMAQPRRLPVVAGAGAAAFIVLVRLFGPSDVDVFFRDLYGAMRFPDAWTFPRYVGHYAPGANFFHASFALSWSHLADIAFMYLYGGGLFFPLLFSVAVVAGGIHFRASLFARGNRGHVLLAVALVAWHVYYLLFYVARLGPREDIDLFFLSFIVIAFFTGNLLDRLIDAGRVTHGVAVPVVALLTGSAVMILPLLVFSGLPPRV